MADVMTDAMTEVRVRPRRDDDMPACVEALSAVHRTDAYPVNWPADPGRWLTPDGLLEAWVAVAGPEVFGHVAITCAAAGQSASVARLFVTSQARRRGVAGALLDAARASAVARGLRLVLEVEDGGRAAIAFYERRGWRRVGTAESDWTTADGRTALMHTYAAPAAGA
ncbi:GNAT family N-acetyltransferase [Streptomyces sp. NBC_01537]|uniref:GNAT family N-acetyltransferase n=1 Tax=Streptomyces sp. NBC_01537 TaxID=2903896 RepID=UPI00386FEACD